ncbi:MAG: response regulator transcription factor [Coprothermobacterota bacterium]|nr:response regulator transcription factor [Coprothermobacterota bacterium]
MIRILLADDHPVVRAGLRAVLEGEPDFEILGEAVDGLDAIRLTESLEPDVLVLDIVMPDMDGLEVTRRVRESTLQTRVVILSIHVNESYAAQALRNGASAYVAKNAPTQFLMDAIRAAVVGKTFFSPPLSKKTIQSYLAKAQESQFDPFSLLSTRERVILQLIAHGLRSTEIGSRLFISSRTVETHRAHIATKLGLRTQAELIHFALQNGMLLMEEIRSEEQKNT